MRSANSLAQSPPERQSHRPVTTLDGPVAYSCPPCGATFRQTISGVYGPAIDGPYTVHENCGHLTVTLTPIVHPTVMSFLMEGPTL